MTSFSTRLIEWQQAFGRHHLPWQQNREAYCIWLSEVMLQQTQVATVIPYYNRFLERFPNVATLASASEEDVLGYWSGLGYYSRARNLHKAAQKVVSQYAGQFPADVALLAELPGVGRSTAAAIAAFAYGVNAAILDGNVKRLLARHAAIAGYPGAVDVQKQLWREAEARLPQHGIEPYTQGLMDLGNLVCLRKNPLCLNCPVRADCKAHQMGRENQFPSPKPKKILPERHCQMFILLDKGRVLLQTRTGPGVWQGLWSLPEVDTDTIPIEFISGLGMQVELKVELAPLRHVFSHYRLIIQPSVWQVNKMTSVHEGVGQWVDLKQLENAPLPTPVRRLLERASTLVV